MISPVFGLMSGSAVSFPRTFGGIHQLTGMERSPESSAVRIASGMVASEAFDVVPCSTPLNNVESARIESNLYRGPSHWFPGFEPTQTTSPLVSSSSSNAGW